MNLPQTLLVPTDFSPVSEQAAAYAVRLTDFFDAEVVLDHVFSFPYDWYYWDVPELDALHCGIEAHAQAKLDALAHRLARRGDALRTRLDVESGVVDTVLASAAAEHAGLIVMGTTGWRGAQGQLGSVTEQILRRSACPVFVVPEHVRMLAEHPRVLATLDLSTTSVAALQWASRLAVASEGQLLALHVLPALPVTPDYLGDEPVGSEEAPMSELRLRALRRFLHRHGADLSGVVLAYAEGEVVEEIHRYAVDAQADIVVVGLSRRSSLRVAERLTQGAHYAVLAVSLPGVHGAGKVTASGVRDTEEAL